MDVNFRIDLPYSMLWTGKTNKQTNIYFIYIFLLFILLDTIYHTLLCFEFVIILYLVSPIPKGLLITHMHCKEKRKPLLIHLLVPYVHQLINKMHPCLGIKSTF